MIRLLVVARAAIQTFAGPAADAGPLFGSGAPRGDGHHASPAPGYSGQVYVTPDGCTYSRAQATGYRPTWHLILNGAAAGLTDAHRRCPSMLGDYQRL